MANFSVKCYHKPQHSKGVANRSLWNINNRHDADDQVQYLIGKAKLKPLDFFIITMNDKIVFKQNL